MGILPILYRCDKCKAQVVMVGARFTCHCFGGCKVENFEEKKNAGL